MALTDSSEIVANYLLEKMQNAAANFSTPVQTVLYGDNQLLPHTPALCVMPSIKTREFQGASLMTLNMLSTYVLVYFGVLGDVQVNLHGCTQLADDVETLVHSDLTLGGNVTSILCMQNEPGVVTKQGDLVMAARLLFTSRTKTRFPNQI